MQNVTHTADNSIVKVNNVYRQTFFLISFMLFILKNFEKEPLNAYEPTDVKS